MGDSAGAENGLSSDDQSTLSRHARACPGHPRLAFVPLRHVDGRINSGHDGE
jgi:hypothetical protein